MLSRISIIIFVLTVLALGRPAGAATHFTATPNAATLIYFNVVDEAHVPAISQAADVEVKPLGLRTVTGFDGQHEPYRTPPERPDMALGAGPRIVLQAINAQLAAYTTSGTLLRGWPKRASQFFGFPRSTYMVDPRAVYDTWDKRYWVAFLGPSPNGYYLAVSQTSDPGGKWYVYGYSISDGPKFGTDFTQLGIDRDAVSISTHLLNFQNGRNIHTAIYALDKHALEHGDGDASAPGFADIAVNGTDLDTIEPVLAVDPRERALPGHLFVSTDGFNFPCYGGVGTCRQMYIFMLSRHGNAASLDALALDTPPYVFTPPADTPKCERCLETVGPMMTTSPEFRNGLISFAFGTGIKVGANNIAGILWGQVRPGINGGHLVSASMYQNGVLAYPHGQAAFFPAVMTDNAGDLFMVFDGSSSTLNPSVYVTGRKASDPLNQLTSTILIRKGLAAPSVIYWGDYTAASYDDALDAVWVASEYAGVNQFRTFIARLRP